MKLKEIKNMKKLSIILLIFSFSYSIGCGVNSSTKKCIEASKLLSKIDGNYKHFYCGDTLTLTGDLYIKEIKHPCIEQEYIEAISGIKRDIGIHDPCINHLAVLSIFVPDQLKYDIKEFNDKALLNRGAFVYLDGDISDINYALIDLNGFHCPPKLTGNNENYIKSIVWDNFKKIRNKKYFLAGKDITQKFAICYISADIFTFYAYGSIDGFTNFDFPNYGYLKVVVPVSDEPCTTSIKYDEDKNNPCPKRDPDH